MSRFCAHSSRRAATPKFSVNDVMWNEDGGGRGGGEEIVPVAKMHAVMHFLLQMCLSHFLLKRQSGNVCVNSTNREAVHLNIYDLKKIELPKSFFLLTNNNNTNNNNNNKKHGAFIDNASHTNSASYRYWPQGVSKNLKRTRLIIRAELSKHIRSQAHDD